MSAAEAPTVPEADTDEVRAEGEANVVVDATAAPAELVAKVIRAIANAGEVVKDKENTEHHYKFASVESMLTAIRQPLYAEGVLLQVRPRSFTDTELIAKSGTKGTRIVVEIDFTFTDGHEQFTIERWRGEAIDYSDKAYGKAYTNAIKTFIRAQWLLPADDDTDHSSPERGAVEISLPPWATPLNQSRSTELLNNIEILIGREAGRKLLIDVKRTSGHLPMILLPTVRAIVEMFLAGDPAALSERFNKARADAESTAEAETAEGAPAADPGDSDVPPDTDGLPAAGALGPEPDPLFDGDGDSK